MYKTFSEDPGQGPLFSLKRSISTLFRNRLISKYTVSTTSHQHIRIASAELEMPSNGIEGVTIISPSSDSKIVVSKMLIFLEGTVTQAKQTVTPVQPANFLFSIDSLSGPGMSLLIKLTSEESPDTLFSARISYTCNQIPFSSQRCVGSCF